MSKGTKPRAVRVDDDLWAAAIEKSKRTGVDVSTIVRMALAEWIAEDEETEMTFTATAMARTSECHTSTFINGEFISQEPGNTMAREAAAKAELIAVYGPLRLVERIVGGNGRVVVSYRTVADR